MLDAVWSARKGSLRANLEAYPRLPKASDRALLLYNIQIYTQSLLTAAGRCREIGWLDDLAQLLLIPFNYLVDQRGHQTWTGEDGQTVDVLSIGQFLYEVSNAVRLIESIPSGERTIAMRELAAKAPPVLLDHYLRWVLKEPLFDFHGSGCDGGISLNLTDSLSLSAWVRSSSNRMGTIALEYGTSYALSLNDGKPEARLVLGGKGFMLTGPTAINDNRWHHVGLTFDARQSAARLYVDGIRVREAVTTGPLQSGSGQIFLGGYHWETGSCCFLSGAIDEVKLYRRMLSDEEMVRLHTCSGSADCRLPDQVSGWSLDHDTDDATGPNSLVTLTGTYLDSGHLRSAVLFDGVSQYSASRSWRGPHTHYVHLLGKKLGQLKDSPDDPDYCHAVQIDSDLHIVAGLVELMAARTLEPSLVSIDSADERALRAYLDLALSLVESRFTDTYLHDFSGNQVIGTILDVGMWRAHPDHTWAGYTGSSFPSGAPPAAVTALGLDISHSRRLVHVFETLHQGGMITGRSFPDETVMRRLANQFAYRAFQGDLSRPLFNNYMDGTNGWYRVGYHGDGFGYAPSDLSSAGVTGGYGFWKQYTPDISQINQALWLLLRSSELELTKIRGEHYGTYWDGGKRVGSIDVNQPDSLYLLMFLPTFAVR